MKSGNLNFLEPSGPLQACNGTDFMWIRTGVYEEGLGGVFCAYRKSVGDEAPSMYSYTVSKGREDIEWEQTYNSTLSLTSALDGVE